MCSSQADSLVTSVSALLLPVTCFLTTEEERFEFVSSRPTVALLGSLCIVLGVNF
jgi:hypothetical protein